MQVLLLYAAVVLIWGSTWAAIVFQLGDVAAELSVGYRFGIAALALYLYALLTRRELRLPASVMPIVALQGLLLFCLNYFLVYYATAYVTSGLIAVLFSSIVVCNALFERLFFKTVIDARLVLAASLGITGIALIFWPEVTAISFEDQAVRGILLALASVVIASLGNMTAVINTRHSLPVVAVNAHAMALAAILAVVISALLGREFTFSSEPAYVVSLLYLAIFGSAIAFGCYLLLIRRIGASRSAYAMVLFPVVALALSTFIEGYRWTTAAVVGVLLTLAGNWLILTRPVQNKPH